MLCRLKVVSLLCTLTGNISLIDLYLLKKMQCLKCWHPIIGHINLLLPCFSYQKFVSLSLLTHFPNRIPLYDNSCETLKYFPIIHYNLVEKHDNLAKNNFQSLLESMFQDLHYIFNDATKHTSSEHIRVGVGVSHTQYNIVQELNSLQNPLSLLANVLGCSKQLNMYGLWNYRNL